ncbi:MAG: hypothetical protein G3M70_02395 [Candidatus Nitronauta litoralis]|uniref:Stringent starvation protein B n=1 Tax=Candidatus Nitronauta litoralis TaxID=2705533 RepID=A0A7T0FZ01_9BACT|nr:MAG: hypothetical protein G3M70_02395 [Candidatus Nitronauta litoralis]
MDPENQNKSEYLLKLLEEGDAMVCLDSRHPAVDVPAAHRNNPMLNLVFNLNFRRPFEVMEDGIYATLAFDRRPHKCVIPFEAVWAIYVPGTQTGQVWENSLPDDLELEGQALELTSQSSKGPKPALKPQPQPQPAPQQAAGAETTPPKPTVKKGKSGRDRSHLRVIK